MKKKIYLFLATFALMALLTPFGAKGQTHTVFQARHLAGTNTPVVFSGTVIENDPHFFIQATDANNNTAGIRVVYTGDVPIAVGDVVTVHANKVTLGNAWGEVWIGNSDISDIAVVGHDDAPLVRNTSLEEMKNKHYPATSAHVMNDNYQHTLVKISNLTVVERIASGVYSGDYILANSNGTRDTLCYFGDDALNLQPGLLLKSVTAVNFRQCGNNTSYNYRKLLLGSPADIEFSTKTIHYARTHLNQTHVVEGVVSYVHDEESGMDVFVSDYSGGLALRFDSHPSLSIGDKVIMAVHPTDNSGRILSSSNTLIAVVDHDKQVTPITTTVADLDNTHDGRVVRIENIVLGRFDVIEENKEYHIVVHQQDQDDYPISLVFEKSPLTVEQLKGIVAGVFLLYLGDGMLSDVTGVYWNSEGVKYLSIRSVSDVHVAPLFNISCSVYPSEVAPTQSLFTASVSPNGFSTTSAAVGQRVYLRLSTTTPNNPSTINYLKNSNANYSNLMFHSLRCTNRSDLEITQVNSTCWSFIMPDKDVDFESIFVPSPNYDAICSDVWEAREGASIEELPFAYLKGVVTYVGDNYFIMEDIHNANVGGDPLKAHCGIEVGFSPDVAKGDNVVVCGRPKSLLYNYQEMVYLTNFRLLSKLTTNVVETPYATDLNTVWADLHGEGNVQCHSRMQSRTLHLSNLTVDSRIGSSSLYIIKQTGFENQAILDSPVELNVGGTYNVIAVDNTHANTNYLFLRLRDGNDLIGANEITFGTNRVEFDEFGGTVSVPLFIGANLVGTPMLTTDSYNMSFTAAMNSDHTAINITVSTKTDSENGIGTITVTMGETSNTMSVVQTACAQAEFTLSPSYAVYDAEEPETLSLKLNNIKHVSQPYSGHVSAEVVQLEDMGTNWITLGSWNEDTRSFSYTLNENTDPEPRGVKIAVTMVGSDGTSTTKEATIWQNPPAAAMTLEPNELAWGETSLCVPVTKTVTVCYENAFDQTDYNADYVWLDIHNLGSDFYTDIVVEPEVVPVDTTGFGTATFTLTYMPSVEGYHDGTLWARIGEYDLVNHEGIPGGAASPWIWASARSSDPFYGWVKLTSMEGVESMGMTQYMLVPMDNTEQGESINFYIPYSEPGYYCIQMSTDYLTWDGSSLSQEYFDPWMDWPESRFLWAISFDVDGNAIISPMDDPSYYISWNNDDEYYTYFECINEGGNPVQIYKLNDGTLPEPTISAESEWFVDGLEVTLTPAEGTKMYYTTTATLDPADPGTYETSVPVTLTLTETTTIKAKSGSCSSYGDEISHTYYKVSNIADVRSAAGEGVSYYIKGVMTYHENDYSLVFLQDETAGIQVNLSGISEYPYNGDEMILSGTPVDNSGSYVTLNNATYETTLNSDVEVEPTTVTYNELASGNYQGMLVKVENVTVGTHGSGYYTLTQNSTDKYLRDEYEGPYPFTLTNGSVIDMTAIYAHNATHIDFLIRDDDEDILVKELHRVYLNAYHDEALDDSDSGWDSYIIFCDAEGNTVSTDSYLTGSTVCFTFAEGFGVGCDAYRVPRVSVNDSSTDEVYADSYSIMGVEADELVDIPNRIFSFKMPNADVNVKVWLQTEIRRTIEGYGDSENGKWAFIANPVEGTNAAYSVDNLFCHEYDFYYFDQTEDQEWRNYKANTFSLTNGQGYLYGSQQDVTLVFKGDFCDEDTKTVNLNYTEDQRFAGWNLVGNPYGETADLPTSLSYYTMNGDGSELVAGNSTTIGATEAIFVQATEAGQSVTFTKQDRSQGGRANSNLSLNLTAGTSTGSATTVIDRVVVRFDEGNTLPKFMLNPHNTKLYVPKGVNDFAVVNLTDEGEIPVNFKVKESGSFTLSIDAKDLEMNYLHLIDNLTGADIDLLATPSYSFDARNDDYAARFKLKFRPQGGNPYLNEDFAFISNGQIVLCGVEGDAVLQVIDVTGRVVLSRDAQSSISTTEMIQGVYMLRLIQDSDVRTQKIVIK